MAVLLSATDVRGAITAAREAAHRWSEAGASERADRLGLLLRECVRRREEIVRAVCSDTAKTPTEALHSDLIPTLENLRYLRANLARVLRARRASTPFIFRDSVSSVEYRARGVVLVIAPWNNPFQLSVVPAAYALGAGNAVVLKPSERAPLTSRLIAELFEQAGLVNGEVRTILGDAAVSQALLEEKPDLVFFTGGTENGRAVLLAAARFLIPVVLELGGKDPMIVFADADLERAAGAATYGAFAHAGQHCISVKRLYVAGAVYEDFLERVAERTRRLGATPEWGRAMDGRAQQIAAAQVREALLLSARLVTPDDESVVASQPTLIADASHAMRIMNEETFAPVLAAMPFNSEDEAVRLANDSPFGLNASVWSRDLLLARRVGLRLATGNVYVNNVLVNVGNPYIPFGGVKASGFGRYHGPEGIRTFCTETSMMQYRGRAGTEPNWFPHDEAKRRMTEEMIDLRYSEQGIALRCVGWIRLLSRMAMSRE